MATKLSQTAGGEAASKPHDLPDPIKARDLMGASFLVLGPPRVQDSAYYPGQQFCIFDVQVDGAVLPVLSDSGGIRRALQAVEIGQWPVWCKLIYGAAKVGRYHTLVDGDGEPPETTVEAEALVRAANMVEQEAAPMPHRERAATRSKTAPMQQAAGDGADAITWTRDTVSALANDLHFPDEKRVALARIFPAGEADRWGKIAAHIIEWAKAEAKADEIAAGKRRTLVTAPR